MSIIREVSMLNAKKLGAAAGIIWGLCMFVCTLIAMHTGYAKAFLLLMKSIYPGYTISFTGSLLGFLYGFADAFIGFFLLAWLYNKFGGSS
jgi:hypothetical protein